MIFRIIQVDVCVCAKVLCFHKNMATDKASSAVGIGVGRQASHMVVVVRLNQQSIYGCDVSYSSVY